MDEQPGYEHSATFASLKGLRETLEGNHTSAQYLETLDNLIDNALQPIIQSTSLFEGFLCQLLGWQEANRKRKVSFLDRHEFTNLACAWLLIPSRIERSFQSRRLRIERGALLEFLNCFNEAVAPYLLACDANLTDSKGRLLPTDAQIAYRREVEAAYNSPVTLRPYILQAAHWTKVALHFKGLIIEKYIRLSLVNAQRDYTTVFEMKVKLDDVIQNYNLAAIRAVDKCDARQGVLTTYIRNWFLTARADILDGIPQDNATASLDETNDHSLEKSTDPPDMETEQNIEHVRTIARLVDPEGYGRAFLGIVESATFIEDHITSL